MRTGIGFDIHRFKAGRKLVLGGVAIEHKVGLDGHSDADVLCHAVADALLGAIEDGDIGTHFPNSDPAWKDASSIDLLRKVAVCVKNAEATINNVDATVIAEEPRITPHAAKMRSNIANAIGIPAGRVSVKATTAEMMGALGRSEGIAVMAVATVDQALP
ncbi:MAG: 2-C-methyl-D-erythritol 2,4-cyclodiphosphate synthase [bacterium]